MKQLIELIKKYKLNQTLIAEEIGMSKMEFYRKLHGGKLSEFEMKNIHEHLSELQVDITEIIPQSTTGIHEYQGEFSSGEFVTDCCGVGPIINEKYCPSCGRRINNER